MTREIKFRGKPAINEERIEELKQYMNEYYDGKFVYGNLIKDNWIVGEVVDSEEEWIALEYWIPVIPETVGQFTGLKDKNVKDIYERDIVKVFMCDSKYRNMKVSFQESQFTIFDENGFGCYIGEFEDYEVIGNIHDNPELFEVSNA